MRFFLISLINIFISSTSIFCERQIDVASCTDSNKYLLSHVAKKDIMDRSFPRSKSLGMFCGLEVLHRATSVRTKVLTQYIPNLTVKAQSGMR